MRRTVLEDKERFMAYSRSTHTVGRVNSVHSHIPFTQTIGGISFHSVLYRLFYLNFSTGVARHLEYFLSPGFVSVVKV